MQRQDAAGQVRQGGDVFFFSSRRRHTRCSRDWSSDVCSSDLCSLYGTPLHVRCYWMRGSGSRRLVASADSKRMAGGLQERAVEIRSEEHTSELQSRLHLVCRLLLEKKKKHSMSSIIATSLYPNHT